MSVATVPQVERESQGAGMQVPFDAIHEPGTYICNWSGHLLRIPKDAVAAGRSPLIDMFGRDRLYATKISDDPYISLTKARTKAAELDVSVGF